MPKLSIHKETKQKFLQNSLAAMATRSGVYYDGEQNILTFRYLNHVCVIDDKAEIYCSGLDLSQNEKTLMLMYLCSDTDLPPRRNWLSFLELPEGEHHYAPFIVEGLKPLATTFSNNLSAFASLCQGLGGTRADLADLSYVLWPFPNLPVLVGIFDGDDEFAAKAILLFDSIAPFYLTTAQLWVLGIEVAQRLTKQSRIFYL